MNFSVYVDDATAAQLKREAARQRRTRNAVVAEAVKQWLERAQTSHWPKDLLDAEPSPALEPFERHRSKATGKARFP